MGVHTVFIILIMLPAAVKTDEGGVTFWRDTVTLTCPEDGDFYDKDDKPLGTTGKGTYEFPYEDKGRYHCEYPKSNTAPGAAKSIYQFYVEGKACTNCFELDATVFLLVIIVDLVATVVVMMMVYKCTKRKDSTVPAKTSRAQAPPRSQAPPVPSPDYEGLNPHTRSLDTYSAVNRMG